MSKFLVFILCLFVRISWQQKDPLNDFCRRFGHQTTVVDQKLYIDGGQVDWNPISQNPNNYTNTWLLYNDLRTSPIGVGVPQLNANLSKNSSIPDVSGGILWADDVNKRFYLYGGDYSGISPNAPQLLSYDIIYNQWESFGTPGQSIQGVAWGGGVGISELGQGYVLGGWLSNNSVPNWSGGPLATSTLIKYDMDSGAWTNNTGPDSTPRAEGVMVYLPASNSGLLVYFGGGTAPYNNDTLVSSPMDTIYIYDIQSSKWYSQVAGGDVPLSRRRFCAGASWAPDHSSYNIYLYGGLGFGANASGFDDVYILSLPSFEWIHWWQSSPPGNPHHSLTCNVVNSGQMLIIGGSFPLSSNCDSPTTWGTHNLDLGKQSGNMWNPYEPNITSYVVPPEIISVIGGSSLGGATATSPAGGFNNSDLSVYFTERASVASRSPTRSIPSPSLSSSSASSRKKLSTGAIAGIAVGGAVVLVALTLAGCCFIHYKRKKQQAPNIPQQQQQQSFTYYNPGSAYSQALNSPQSPYHHGSFQHAQHYQLPAPQIPAELSGNSYQMDQVDPSKDQVIQQMQESPQLPYGRWRGTPPPQPSPTFSPQQSAFSPESELSASNTNTMYDIQSSPTSTYSSPGRITRKQAQANLTYYRS